jgi:hypothetical protein
VISILIRRANSISSFKNRNKEWTRGALFINYSSIMERTVSLVCSNVGNVFLFSLVSQVSAIAVNQLETAPIPIT